MNWAGLDAGLIAAIREAAGDPNLPVFWQEQPQGWRADTHVKLDLIGFGTVGPGEIRRVVSATQIQQRVYQVRTLTLQVTCETQSQTLANSSLALADDISAGLRREDVRDLLNTSVDLGVATVGGITHASYTDGHKRRRSASVFPVTFNAQTTRAGRLIDFIRSVSYEGVVIKPDNSEVALADTVELP